MSEHQPPSGPGDASEGAAPTSGPEGPMIDGPSVPGPSPTAPAPRAWVPPSPSSEAGFRADVYASPGAVAAVPAPARRRASGWVWPGVAALALVVGVLGGMLGGSLVGGNGDDVSLAPVGGSTTFTPNTTPPLKAKTGSIPAVAQTLLPSTVQISAEYDGQKDGATGSGFVIDDQGHVVTNNHVVASAASDNGPIEITDQNGDRFTATLVGRSPVYDLAVLYAPEVKKLTPASLGSVSTLRVGDPVVAFGSPLGLSSTVTSGIVSALDRPVTTGDSANESSYIDAVQTDAAINPGNSGGPLVNLDAQVVGINSAIATTGGGSTSGSAESGNIGVGFAIPIDQVKVTVAQILATGEARYPVIGAQVRTGGADDGSGATIVEVESNSPSSRAGLDKGDRITAVDGTRVTDGISLIVMIRTHQPGQKIQLTVVRGSQVHHPELTLGSEVG